MERRKLLAVLVSVILVMPAARIFAKAVNLSGIWSGKAQTPNGEDSLTLILQKVKGTYTGMVNDTLGMATNVKLENPAFKDGVLAFDLSISGPDGPMTIHISLKVTGDKMSGEWNENSGTTGAIELEKQKPEPKKK